MGKDIDFINEEKRYWGKIYTNIEFAISDVSQFLPENRLKVRKYYSKSQILKKYIELLNSAEADSSKKSFFNIFKDNSSMTLLQDYKAKNREYFKQFEQCSDCQCLKCDFDCNFKSCSSCRNNSHLTYCDKHKANVRKFDNFILDLTNNDTGKASKYKVLAVVEDCEIDQLYILVQNLSDSNDKLVLYYYPGIKEDTFGEITNVDEFDFVVQTYQDSE